MPPQVVSLRPQTSHQARRAYLKAGGAPRLSEVEQRQLERSAELEARAARIRAHNTRARENKRKRAEKLEKERETRKRMGISEPTKIKISPSQLSLGTFVETKPRVKGEEIHPSKVYVKEETPERLPHTGPSPAYCVSNTDAPDHLESEQQRSKNFTPPPSSHKAVPRYFSPPPSKGKKARPASLMPPPPSRAPLRKTSVNKMARPSSKPHKDDLSTMIGNDWDSFFDSNTQVEREISSYKEKPPAQYPPPQVTPDIPVNSFLMVASDLLANISTQDLQYSSSPPSPAKGNNDQVSNLVEGYENELPPNGTRQPEEATITLKERRLTSSLCRNELETITTALLNSYCHRLSLPDIRRLISGQRLDGDAAVIPPRLVTLMAIKIEEERRPRKPPPMPIELMRWATSMQEVEAKEEKQATPGRAKVNSHCSKTAFSNRDFALPDRRAADTRPVSTNKGTTTSRSFDEFDGFDLSTQDLREFDV
ncbi:MAG: hypothetical protein Q9188_003142 [Gyalolechia gomerana]